jgi:large subunit ribosomal protein L19
MRQSQVIDGIEAEYLSKEEKVFHIGDTVCVQVRIIEGDKERLQSFTGTVIARKGKGLSETFSLYRNAYGCCMERVFFLHSPRIGKIEVIRAGKVRRAKLYYIRGASGKAAKVAAKERRTVVSTAGVSKEPTANS